MSVPAKAASAGKQIVKKAQHGAEAVGGFVNDQLWGPEAQAYLKQAMHPKQDFNQASQHSGYARMGDIAGITDNPMALKLMNVVNNLTNAATHSGVGKWFGADSAQNITNPNSSVQSNLGDIANVLFSIAPLGAGNAAKKAKGAAHMSGKELLSMVNMIKGMTDGS